MSATVDRGATPVGVGDLAKAPIAQATQRALSGPSLRGSVGGDQEDRLAGLISLGGVGGRGEHLTHKLQSASPPKLACLGCLLPSPSPTTPPNSSTAETSAWLKPAPRRAPGAVSRCWSLCWENFARNRGRWTKIERGGGAFARRRGTPSGARSSLGLRLVPGRTRCSEPSLPKRGVAGSGHIPAPSGTKRRQAGEAKAEGWTLELSRVGGGEQGRGAKLSNCARSPVRGGGREGRGVERRGGRELRASERARRA